MPEMLTLRHQAWNTPDVFEGWKLPHGGQWGPTQHRLDPGVFDHSGKMLPWVRLPILSMLDAFWAPRYVNWKSWAKVYLAGSMASYWWGTPDVDILIGVDLRRFNATNPTRRALDEEGLSKALTDELRVGLDHYTDKFAFPPSPDYQRVMKSLGANPLPIEAPPGTVPLGDGGAEVTWYVNRASYDLRKIRPYAAYDLSANTWSVRPVQMPKTWGPNAMPPAFWRHMVTVANGITAVMALPEPERSERAKVTYDAIHAQRSAAYGTRGRGIFDPGSLQWISLVRWGLIGELEGAMGRPVAHPAPASP